MRSFGCHLIAFQYIRSRLEPNPLFQFQNKQNMKQFYFLSIVLFSFAASAQIVTIPDASFKASLTNHSPAIDTNFDGEIQVSEALATTILNINGGGIGSLTGLDAFTNVTSLTFNYNSAILNSGISSLNVTALSNLQTLICSQNAVLQNINISGLTQLTKLDCNYSPVAMINNTGAVNLLTFNCSYGNIQPFFLNSALANMPHLKELDCRWNNHINALDLGGVPELERLFCSNNQLTSLDISAQPNLNLLYCEVNQISELDLSNHTRLNQVNCSGNPLTTVDFSSSISGRRHAARGFQFFEYGNPSAGQRESRNGKQSRFRHRCLP